MAMLPAVLAVSACNKDVDSYSNDPRVYFFERTNSAIPVKVSGKSFTFVLMPATVTEDTLLVAAKIMGAAAKTDRSFAAAADTGSTATPTTDYKILPGVIKADSLTGYLPVVLYRREELKTVIKKLNLKIVDGGDFKAGATEEIRMQLLWNDNLIKPANWDTRPGLVTYFGAYSTVKYRFIIDVLGRSEFPLQTSNVFTPGMLTNAAMMDLKDQVRVALQAYNASHTPALTDENGQLVILP
ncbi:DUF4843 domain-containing protein [Chitinophaga horti]|uniref:DUF4843 domain-containing protein n=1 Tax=Chitinophaga horti TaxID=2920382 RepID=A0ABY6J7M1_9BACT|nr:DUF4843 domain-containing protein [Chitinophaga horti]UYQ95485.1 DUF4843 domain-containing protein [Chitinophaga horti]